MQSPLISSFTFSSRKTMHLEQQVLAQRVSELGVGPWITPRRGRGEEVGRMLDGVLSDVRYAAAAEGFAARHRGLYDGRQRGERFEQVLRLLDAGERRGAEAEAGSAVSAMGDWRTR